LTPSRDKLERLEKANAGYKSVIEKSSETERHQFFKIKELQDENEILKSKVVDCTKCQSFQKKRKELNSINESLTTSVQKLLNSHERGKAKLTQRDEKIFVLQKKLRLLEEQSKVFHEKEMRDTVKRFDGEKKVFENKISKLEKVLGQRVKDFDDVKTELSRRTDKFETYFTNLKENALLKSQLTSQNYTSLQKKNNDLRTSYNVLKEEYEISCVKLEKENNGLKMHYKILFDSIKQKKAASQVFTKSIPKVNVSEKISKGESSKPISKKVD
nr:outer membrane protein porin [Tanacetum cinerariifolium]